MRKVILLVVVLVLLWCTPVMAGEFHGKVFSKIELYNDYSGELWGIDLHYDFDGFLKNFSLGTELTTITDGFVDIGYFPSCQDYEIYIQYRPLENISFKLAQWCKHPIINTTNKTYMYTNKDVAYLGEGIYFMAEITF